MIRIGPPWLTTSTAPSGWRARIRSIAGSTRRGDVLRRLAVAPAAADGVGKALRDLDVGQSLPAAEVLLPQSGVE